MTGLRVLITASLIVLIAAGCARTQYVSYGERTEPKEVSDVTDRTVEFQLERAYYDDPPECVIVLPFLIDGRQTADSRLVEATLERHFAPKFRHVVGRAEREDLVRRLMVDAAQAGDRKVLAREARCPFLLESKPWKSGDTYLVVWSQAKFGLDLTLVRAADSRPVWRARHAASRSEGGLPTDLFSLPLQAFQASAFHADQDIRPSVIDDAVRRMARTLPDFGRAMAQGWQGSVAGDVTPGRESSKPYGRGGETKP